MYKYNSVPFGFIVLYPNYNFRNLKVTVRSIKGLATDSSILIAAPQDIPDIAKKEASVLAPIIKGKNTHTSLINQGLKKTESDWNFIIYAGSTLKYRFFHKYAYFLEDERDVMFPIVDWKYDFVNGTMNGIFMNKKFFKIVGDFEDVELNLSKLEWATRATERGARLKALMGVRIV
jgi:hypothetical protein